MPVQPPERINRFAGPYCFLSNFYLLPDGSTLEHAYQAHKAQLPAEASWVMAAPTPTEAKKRGRKVTLRKDWEAIKNKVMLALLRDKFAAEPLRSMLLATGSACLEEGNTWHDDYWGNCTCPMHARTSGANWLGKLLMQVREELRKDDKGGQLVEGRLDDVDG